jgi:hypothetical protein
VVFQEKAKCPKMEISDAELLLEGSPRKLLLL